MSSISNKCVQASLPNLYEYKEKFEPVGVEIISPLGDIEEVQCEGGACAISMTFDRSIRQMYKAKAA